MLGVYDLRYKVITGIKIYLFIVLREQFNPSSGKPLGHLFSIISAETGDMQDKQYQTTFSTGKYST